MHTIKLDTGCVADRYATAYLVTTRMDVRRYVEPWLHRHRDDVLGLDAETNAENPFSPDYRLRLVQIADADTVFLLDAQALGPEVVADVVRRHPLWVAHFSENDIRFCERGAPGSVRLSDDTPHFVDLQVPLAYYDPRTVVPAQAKDGIDPRLARGKGLKETCTRELSDALAVAETQLHQRFRELAPKGHRVGDKMRKWGFANIDIEDEVYLQYSALDPLMTLRLWVKFADALKRADRWGIVFRDLVWQWDIDRATFRGLMVDAPYAQWLDQQLCDLLDDNAALLDKYGIKPSGMGPQVAAAFHTLGVHSPKVSKDTGAESFDKDVIKDIADGAAASEAARALARAIKDVRQATKFRAAYIEPMLTALETDGRVHWSHRAIGTITGRNSAARPALQQLPKKDTRVRAAYRAPDGWSLVSCDFSQGEPRTMAALSGDANLKAAILSGDLNSAIATDAFGDDYDPAHGKDAGTPHYLMRQQGKAGFLAKCYGARIKRLASTLNVTMNKAATVDSRWDRAYADLFALSRELNRHDRVTLESGRICPLWDRYRVGDSGSLLVKPDASRKGLNYKTQGTQRDLLLASWERMRALGWASFLWMLVHDEVIICVPTFMAELAARDLEDCMTFTWRGMPFVAEAEINGRNWTKQPDAFTATDLDILTDE